jgi:hypothetical protein
MLALARTGVKLGITPGSSTAAALHLHDQDQRINTAGHCTAPAKIVLVLAGQVSRIQPCNQSNLQPKAFSLTR